MFKLIAAFAVLPAILALTPVRRCTGNQPLPDAVFFGSREDPCLAEPCAISRSSGRGVTYVDFTVPFASQSMMPRVRATVFGGSVTFTQELPEAIRNNPCGILTKGSCPFSAGDNASYRLELPVDPTTPLIPSDVEITLFGDNNAVIFCYRLDNILVV